MKRTAVSILFLALIFSLTACNYKTSESTELKLENSELKATYEELKSENAELEKKLSEAESSITELQESLDKAEANQKTLQESLEKAEAELKDVTDEYSAYKEKMSDYEELSEAEAEARQIEADRIIAEAEAEKKRAEEEAAKEKEEKEKQGYNTGITYEQLARTPDDYFGEKVKFTGKVLQVMEGNTETHIRVSLHKSDYGWYDTEQVLYCGYVQSSLPFRILENDIITLYGSAFGLYSYETVSGTTITLPCVWIDKVELKN